MLRMGPKRWILSVPFFKSPISLQRFANIWSESVVRMAHMKADRLKFPPDKARSEPVIIPARERGSVRSLKLRTYA